MANFNLDNYVPVHERIEKFYQAHENGRIVTQIERLDESGLVIFKAAVYRSLDDAEPSATGHAYEQNGSSYINKTSYIENCETSAIGRALANLGIEVSRGIASREEMQKVERMQAAEKPAPIRQSAAPKTNGNGKTKPAVGKARDEKDLASQGHAALIGKHAMVKGSTADAVAREYFSDVQGVGDLSRAAALYIIEELQGEKQ